MVFRVAGMFFLGVVVCSCKISERNVAGVYRLDGPSKTKLVLNPDQTFEFVKNFSEPGPAFFPDSTDFNFTTAGTWKLDPSKKIILSSYSQPLANNYSTVQDSMIPTTITSFSFWDKDGDPVAIRLMKFPTDKIKLYNANSISFFAGDFGLNDTLEFHFYGYPPVKWPGIFSRNIADNYSHRITLSEPERPAYFQEHALLIKRRKLLSTDKSFVLYRGD